MRRNISVSWRHDGDGPRHDAGRRSPLVCSEGIPRSVRAARIEWAQDAYDVGDVLAPAGPRTPEVDQDCGRSAADAALGAGYLDRFFDLPISSKPSSVIASQSGGGLGFRLNITES